MSGKRRVRLTRIFLFTFLGMLSLCAAFGIIAAMAGEFDETVGRLFLFSTAAAYYSLLGLGCATLLERSRGAVLAYAGIATAAVTFALASVMIWHEDADSETMWRTFGVLNCWSLALALVSLIALARVERKYLFAPVATALLAFVLAGLISALIMFGSDPSEGLMRAMVVVSILVVLGTISTPVLHRISALEPELAEAIGETVELFCPRCRRRQTLLLGADHCHRCGLEIGVTIATVETAKHV